MAKTAEWPTSKQPWCNHGVPSLASSRLEARPFLKWAGGKRQLLPALRRFYPDTVPQYFEPFLGSGAVFFDLWNLGRLRESVVRLTDDNADLIGCYLRLRDAVESVVRELEALAEGHTRRGNAHYLEVRDEHFNPERRAWRERGGSAQDYSASLAAMLIYLNRTGYNGLFRLNARGDFNVPPGRYENPIIADSERLRRVASMLQAPNIEIQESPFERIDDSARSGDLVYLDPPYAPTSATASFRSYTARGFGEDDQMRLRDLAACLSQRRVNVILSNSTASSIAALYERDMTTREAGLQAYRVRARRAINSRSDRRGFVDELIVSNVPPQDRDQESGISDP